VRNLQSTMNPYTFALKSPQKIYGFWKQNSFKIDQQMACNMECLILPPFEAPRRPKDGLLAPQDAPEGPPRRLQDGPRHPQDSPNCAQLLLRQRRSPSSLDVGPSRPRCWTLQTYIFDPPDFDLHPFKY